MATLARRVLSGCALLLWLVPGPAQAQSSQSTAGAVDVHFTTTEPGVTVYSRPVPRERLAGAELSADPPEFQAVCEAPCDAALTAAVQEFALAPTGSSPIPVTPAFELKADARFRGDVISHASERRTGWWILGILGGIGLTSTTIGLAQTCVDDQTCQQWTSLAIWSGLAVMTAGALIGLPKIATEDEATLTLVPGAALSAPAGAQPPGTERASLIPGGATVSGHF